MITSTVQVLKREVLEQWYVNLRTERDALKQACDKQSERINQLIKETAQLRAERDNLRKWHDAQSATA